MKLFYDEALVLEFSENVEYPFIAITLSSTLNQSGVVPVSVASINQIELFNLLLNLKPFNYEQINELLACLKVMLPTNYSFTHTHTQLGNKYPIRVGMP